MEDRASYQMRLVESKKNRLYTNRISLIAILFIGIFFFFIGKDEAYQYIDLKTSHIKVQGTYQTTIVGNEHVAHHYSYKDTSGKSYVFKRLENINKKTWKYKQNEKPKYSSVPKNQKKITIFFSPAAPQKSYGLYTGGWLANVHLHYIFNRIGLILIIFTSLMIPYYGKKIYCFNKRIKLGFEHK